MREKKQHGGARPDTGPRNLQTATVRRGAPLWVTLTEADGGVLDYGKAVIEEIIRSGASRIVVIRLATGETLRVMVV